MTIFKNSILLALVVGPCFGATAEFSPKHKSTVQATGSLVSTAFAALGAYLIVKGVKEKGIQKFFYKKDNWLRMGLATTSLGITTCLYYVGYRLGKDARNSYRKAFYPKKDSKNSITSENTSELTDTSTAELKNPQEEIAS
ncbi:hypothetical protein H0X06_06985 [Candidatus Dependentiae bacterium]|nr:hypothetical protein [Candidatus Dependentiae bacterium]